MRKLSTTLLLLSILLIVFSTTAFADTIISSEAEEHILDELRRARIPNAAMFTPASMTPAIIATWIGVVYSLCSNVIAVKPAMTALLYSSTNAFA